VVVVVKGRWLRISDCRDGDGYLFSDNGRSGDTVTPVGPHSQNSSSALHLDKELGRSCRNTCDRHTVISHVGASNLSTFSMISQSESSASCKNTEVIYILLYESERIIMTYKNVVHCILYFAKGVWLGRYPNYPPPHFLYYLVITSYPGSEIKTTIELLRIILSYYEMHIVCQPEKTIWSLKYYAIILVC